MNTTFFPSQLVDSTHRSRRRRQRPLGIAVETDSRESSASPRRRSRWLEWISAFALLCLVAALFTGFVMVVGGDILNELQQYSSTDLARGFAAR